MSSAIFFKLIFFLFWPALLMGVIAYVKRRRKNSGHNKE